MAIVWIVALPHSILAKPIIEGLDRRASARGIKTFQEEKLEKFLTIEEMQKRRESIESYHDVSARVPC